VAPLAAASAVILAVGLAVVLGGQVQHGGQPGRADDRRAETAYVFNGYQGTVTPISPATGRLGKPVTVGPPAYSTGHGKRRIENARIRQDLILPDGTTNYALYFQGRGNGATEVLQRTSLVTGAAGQPIQLGRRPVQQMLITPDGRTAYLTYVGSADSTIRPVSLATGTVGKPILRAPRATTPWITPVMTPDGRTIYVVYLRRGTVIPISTATNTVGKPIPVPGAFRLLFTSSGRTAFVIGRGTVTPISTATNTPGATISTGRHNEVLTVAPDGKTVYAVNYGGASVTPFSTRTGRAGQVIRLPDVQAVIELVITPDGRTGYATGGGRDDRVIPVSLARSTAGKPLAVRGAALNLVMTPDGRTVYAYTGLLGGTQVVTPISAGTSTAGKPIRVTGPGIEVLVPGDQNP
jgi:DNA-binding beta-propeller fold protein YncE